MRNSHGNNSMGTPSAHREGDRLLLAGVLTMDTVPALSASARLACAGGEVRVVDFAAVTTLDSAAIALALELGRAGGTALRFENLPPAALNLARLYSVADQLGIDV